VAERKKTRRVKCFFFIKELRPNYESLIGGSREGIEWPKKTTAKSLGIGHLSIYFFYRLY
jgi:hypothetical protein